MFWSANWKWFFQESGSEKVEPDSSTKVKKIGEYGSIKDFINEVYLLPYLTIGGSREVFWELTPKEITIDFKAYKKKMEIQEQLMWKQGLYFKQALQSTVLACGLADKNVAGKMPKYPDMPKFQEEEKEINVELQRQLLIAKMNKWQMVNNLRNKR